MRPSQSNLTKRTPRVLAQSLACGVMMMGASAASASLTNGNFEADPFDTDWTNTGTVPATQGAGFAPGSTQSASLVGTGTAGVTNGILQDTESGFSEGTLSFWIQTTTFDSGDRSFNLVVGTDFAPGSNSGINLRLAAFVEDTDTGTTTAALQSFDDGWESISDFAFAEDSIYYFELEFAGLGTGDIDDASYTVSWSNAGATEAVTDNTSGEQVRFQTDSTITGGALDRIRFASATNDDGYSVDDVTLVPEPTSLALLGLGGLCMMSRRRRR